MPPRASGYNNGDLLRMTWDAEQRVREMRERARNIVQNEDTAVPPAPRRQNRSWSTDAGRRRVMPPPAPPVPPMSYDTPPEPEPPPPNQHPETDHRPGPPPRDATTIIQDIVGAVGVEEDTLLILGLILILINQKADTTLILALAYLLI